MMEQIAAAIDRGENPDEFLAKNIYHRDMKKIQKKMNQYSIEYAENQQLKQIMEESKKQAMNDAGIMNDDMTYEVSNFIRFIIIHRRCQSLHKKQEKCLKGFHNKKSKQVVFVRD